MSASGDETKSKPVRPRSQRLAPDDRKRQILRAAVQYFAEVGFGGGTRELARRLQVTQPLIYRYFPSKEDLIQAVYQEVYLTRWQPDWDRDRYDRRHVILGTVSNFRPFRLQVARRNGTVQTIDLKQGTRIFPRGETPSVNERVAVSGYYSNGTFIANRVILHD